MYLESLLRDRPFTIRTDHRDLLFIKQSSSGMIVRWYMALSEFTFNIEFISGDDNGIADSMSRLCRNNIVGQSTMQLTCCDTTRNFRKIRL